MLQVCFNNRFNRESREALNRKLHVLSAGVNRGGSLHISPIPPRPLPFPENILLISLYSGCNFAAANDLQAVRPRENAKKLSNNAVSVLFKSYL